MATEIADEYGGLALVAFAYFVTAFDHGRGGETGRREDAGVRALLSLQRLHNQNQPIGERFEQSRNVLVDCPRRADLPPLRRLRLRRTL